MTYFPQPKPLPYLLEKRKVRRDREKIDREESAKVRQRSGGRCEVLEYAIAITGWVRCRRRAAPGNHHLIGGSGRRNRGRSILAAHRLDVCQMCHTEITNGVLKPCNGAKKELAAEVMYERRG